MPTADSLDLKIRLDRSGLTSDLSSAQQQINRAFGQLRGPDLNFRDQSRAIQNLEGDLAAAQARASQGTRGGAAAARTAAQYQEAIRHAAQLEKINEAIANKELVGADDIANARRLADEINRINLEAIDTEQFRQGLQGVAAVSGAAATAIGGVFAAGTAEFVTFDRNVRQAGIISRATAEDTEILRAEIERLGIETSKAPAEVAAMTVSLSRAGFAATESTDALEGIVRASEATGESLGGVGDIVAKTLRTFDKAAEESGAVADALVATANNSNTSIGSLGESLSEVGSFAAGSNQPLEDTLVLIGLLGDAGIQGSKAGTNLGAALDRLKVASAGAETEFSGLVRGSAKATAAFEAIGAEVRNADGSMKSVLDILPVVRNNIEQLSQQDQDILLKALFGVEGGRAFQTLLNRSQADIDSLTETVRNSEGVAIEAGEAMLQGLGGALDLLGGSASATAGRFGEVVAVGLDPMVRAATAALNSFLALPAPLQTIVVGATGLAGAFAAATAALTTYQALGLAQQATLTKQAALQILNAGGATAHAAAQTTLAVATGTASKAQLAQLATLGRLGAGFAVAAAGAFTLRELLRRSEGAQFAAEAREEIEQLTASTDDAIASSEAANDSFSRIGESLNQGGLIEATRASLVELQAALFGTADAADTYGNRFGFITAEQRGNQLAQLATADAIAATSQAYQEGLDLLSEYGLTQADAADKARLGAEGIREFKAAAEEQIATLDENIAALERLANSASNDAQREQLENEIALYERQRNAIAQRITFLEQDASATEANANAQEVLVRSLDEVAAAYDRSTAELKLAATERKAAIAESLASSGDEDAAAADQLAADQDFYQERLDLARQNVTDLQAALNATSGDDRIEAENKLLQAEQEVADARIQLAKSTSDAKKAEAQKAAEAQEEASRREADAAREAEQVRREAIARELAAVEEGNAKAEAAVIASQQKRLATIKSNLLAQNITEVEATRQIAELRQDSIADEAKLLDQQIANIKRLKSQQILSEAEATAQIRQLQQELGANNLDRLDAELEAQEKIEAAAKKAADAQIKEQERIRDAVIKSIDQRVNAERLASQAASGANQLRLDAIAQEQTLLQARAGLQSSLNSLAQEEIKTKLAVAKANGNDAQAERLKAQLRQAALQQQEAEFDSKRKALELQTQQNALQGEQARLAAQVAQIEAQANLEKAKANGASAAEIAALEKIVTLRGRQLTAVDQGIQRQDELARIQRRQLDTEEAIAKERLRQQEIADASANQRSNQQANQRQDAPRTASNTIRPTTIRSGADPVLKAREQAIQRQSFSGGLDNAGIREALSADPANNPFLAQLLGTAEEAVKQTAQIQQATGTTLERLPAPLSGQATEAINAADAIAATASLQPPPIDLLPINRQLSEIMRLLSEANLGALNVENINVSSVQEAGNTIQQLLETEAFS